MARNVLEHAGILVGGGLALNICVEQALESILSFHRLANIEVKPCKEDCEGEENHHWDPTGFVVSAPFAIVDKVSWEKAEATAVQQEMKYVMYYQARMKVVWVHDYGDHERRMAHNVSSLRECRPSSDNILCHLPFSAWKENFTNRNVDKTRRFGRCLGGYHHLCKRSW